MKQPIENYVEGSFIFSEVNEAGIAETSMRGSSKEVLSMTLAIIYGVLKIRKTDISPIMLFRGISEVLHILNKEEDNYSRFADETLPPDIEAEIDEVWDDLAELLGGSDDHCS